MRVVELRAVRGRAMVAGVPLSAELPGGRLWGLPPDLVDALQEWARVAATVRTPSRGPGAAAAPAGSAPGTSAPGTSAVQGGDGAQGAVVSRRGRHLAARLSVVLKAPVDYCDPVSGHRIALRGLTRPRGPLLPQVPRAAGGGPTLAGAAPAPDPEGAVGEPTPWVSGIALGVLVAGLVLLANLALAAPMVTGLGVLGLAIDVVVVAGLVPALWLNRRAPTWRWAVYGTFAGMALAWPFLAVQAFG